MGAGKAFIATGKHGTPEWEARLRTIIDAVPISASGQIHTCAQPISTSMTAAVSASPVGSSAGGEAPSASERRHEGRLPSRLRLETRYAPPSEQLLPRRTMSLRDLR